MTDNKIPSSGSGAIGATMPKHSLEMKDQAWLIGSLKVQSNLVINQGLQIQFTHPMPNLFWRLMQWLLLGWKWEVVGKDS